jgi:hypothetical protein
MTATAGDAPPREAHLKNPSAEVGYRGEVTTAETPRQRDFRDASPRQIRDALIPEDVAKFDRDWQELMTKAREALDLAEVLDNVEYWRRHAAITNHLGHDGYRDMLARAEHRLRTGERAPDTVSWTELKAELGL